MNELVKQLGLYYFYDDFGSHYLTRNTIDSNGLWGHLWGYRWPNYVHMKARRLSQLQDLMASGLVTKEVARQLVGLPTIE